MDTRAVVMTGTRSLGVEKLPVPDDPPVGGAILRVLANGICGSDWDLYSGVLQEIVPDLRFPMVPGHEMVGEIAVIDPAAALTWGVEQGDRVVVESGVRCGECRECVAGRIGRCLNRFGYSMTPLEVGSGLWGGMAEYMVLLPRSSVYKVPDGVSVEDASLFNPLGNSFHWTLESGGARAGQRVLVLGPGQRGLAAAVAATEAGAAQVIVTGLRRDAHKLQLAPEFGASEVIDVEEEDTVDAVRTLTRGLGVDLVVDTTPGDTMPILHAIDALAPGGTIVLAGMKGRPLDGLVTERLIGKEGRIVGSNTTTPWSVTNALRVISAGNYPFHKLHSHTVGLEETERAIRILGGEIEGEQPIHITIRP
jgi:threonine dehydrogenase-like Zn-dependent dehydrogenase